MITFIDDENWDKQVSFASVYRKARFILFQLQQRGLKPRDELVIQLEENSSFVFAFWACILGGIVPVPLTPVKNPDTGKKLLNTFSVLNNPYLLTDVDNLARLEKQAGPQDKLVLAGLRERCLMVEAVFVEAFPAEDFFVPAEDDIAYIQFSSGSTSNPKGVVLTHKNLVTNIRAILNGINSPAGGDIFLSWMPLTHDMGLIGYHLTPFFAGWSHCLMSTNLFIRRPVLWLEKLYALGATFTASPNFGYNYVLEHFNTDSGRAIDLSSVRIITNGAEPISNRICREFTQKFKNYGLREGVIFPVYGLAEASLAVTFSTPGSTVKTVHVDRRRLEMGRPVVFTGEREGSIELVSVGKAVDDCSVRIVDETGNGLAEATLGTIVIKGDNVTRGYYNDAEATGKVISGDHWLNTGDTGFVLDNELYVAGRVKDIIFANGQNFYSHDLEYMIAEAGIADLSLGKIIVAGGFHPVRQAEVVLAFILYKGSIESFLPVASEIRKLVYRKTGVELLTVLPLRKIPKTTSGKLQRFKCWEGYLDDEFNDNINRMNLLQAANAAAAADVRDPMAVEEWLTAYCKKSFLPGPVDPWQSFFEWGINSMQIGQLVISIREQLGIHVPVTEIYATPNVRSVAALISRSPRCKAAARIDQTKKRPLYAVSHAQKRIFYEWYKNPTSVAYNVAQAVNINRAVDPTKLEEAFRALIRRHESLRTAFLLKDDEVYQIVADDCPFSLVVGQTAPTPGGQTGSWVTAFDLAKAPLVRATLLQPDGQDSTLLIEAHHVVVDGVSLTILLDELLRLYEGEPLEELHAQMKDYAVWERESADFGQTMATHEKYWLQCLAGTLPLLNLPVDYPRPAFFSYRGKKVGFGLDETTSAQLRTLARKLKTTNQVLLQSFYLLLLHKYAHQDELVIGVPVACRQYAEIQKTAGMFVNNLVIKSKAPNGQPFSDFVLAVSAQMSNALDNQEYPFDQLVDALGVKKDASRNAVIDSMFMYRNPLPLTGSGRHLKAVLLPVDPEIAKYDLSLEVIEEEGFRFFVEYATDLFKGDTISIMIGYFTRLIKQALENPHVCLGELSLGAWQEKTGLCPPAGEGPALDLGSENICRIFERQADASAGALALACGTRTMTYAQLNACANQLAKKLVASGVKPDVPVCLLMDRTVELIIGVLAILKAGGAYLPLDNDYPAERKSYIVADSGTNVFVTTRAILDGESNAFLRELTGKTTFCLDDPACFIGEDGNLPLESGLHHLAYLIYTSGSSGKPKGVAVEHGNLLNYMLWAKDVYAADGPRTFPLFTSISFDLTVTSLWLPLITGGTLVIYPEQKHESAILRVIEDNRSAVVKLTPAHLSIINEISQPQLDRSVIEKFIVGGEQLDRSLALDIYRKFGQSIAIFNEYGPTEATVGCMIHRFDPVRDKGEAVAIGLPSANNRIFLFNESRQPVPTGMTGEIYIGGKSVSRGYVSKPQLTREWFVSGAFAGHDKLYRTGDLAVVAGNGVLTYIGRKDGQVKINGYRVELSEIENALKAHPAVSDAKVVLKNDTLLAYYLASSPLEARQLKAHAAGVLPHYMQPLRYLRLEKFPLTPHGKVDLEALPAMPAKAAGRAASRTEAETTLLRVFAKVMGLEHVSLDDNYYELGGDSIKAIRIISMLGREGYSLTMQDVLKGPLLADTASRLRLVQQPGEAIKMAGGSIGPTPVTAWFFSQQLANPHYFSHTVLLELKQDIPVEHLEAAFTALLNHHDGLRIRYDDGQEGLCYADRVGRFNVHVFSAGVAETEATVTRAKEELCRSIHIGQAPLLRVGMIHNPDGTRLLLIVAHHLVIDGVSWRILLEDLYAICDALRRGTLVSLPAKTASYREWQQRMDGEVAEGVYDQELAYWENRRPVPVSLVPEKAAGQPGQAKEGKVPVALDQEQTAVLLREASQTFQADPQLLLLASLAAALRGWVAQDTVVIELENHGRSATPSDVTRTIGWFTAIFPFRCSLQSETMTATIAAIVAEYKNIPRQGAGYGALKYLAGKIKDDGARQLPFIRFNYMGAFDEEASNDLLTVSFDNITREAGPDNEPTAVIEINLLIVHKCLRGSISYASGHISAEAVQSFAERYLNQLQAMLAAGARHNGYFTPADFALSRIDEEDLSVLFG